MDREIPKEVRNKERNKKIIRYGGMGWCPSLEIDIHESGDFSGPLTYYVSGLAEDHFWCNTQGQRFDRL